ncbi:hypothetical protein [Virgibacillus doumboii]|uniref:hypothetical protein n=1 Tax=Virgibacillus doumboii TaxID=2697503 RepID=UPI0013DF3CD1|nr:hypothetical protein [Virgibacillus doumboii]
MDREKYLKIFGVFVAVVLVISLVMNFKLLSGLNQLENQVSSISSNQHNITRSVSNETNHIQSVLNDMKKEQSWISDIKMNVDSEELEDGEAAATFEWQVKEFQKDSEVVFNYAYGNSEDFTAIPAKELEQGLFQAEVPFEVEMGPQWEVMVTDPDSKPPQGTSKQEIEEKHRQQTLKYFVSVSNDDKLRSGEIQTQYLGKLGTERYGTIHSDVHLREKNVSVTVNNHNIKELSNVVEEAYLLKYENEKLIEEEKMKLGDEQNSPDHQSRLFHLDQLEQYEDMRLVVKVVYSNGETFEKEVY